MRLPARWLLLTTLAIAGLAVGCGTNDEEGAIRDLIVEFLQAMSEDAPQAYVLLADECKDELEYPQFATNRFLFDGLLGDREPVVREFEVLTREDDEVVAEFLVVIEVDGEDVLLSATDGESTRFLKEDGRWRFGNCEDFLPLGSSSETEAVPIETGPSPLEVAVLAEGDDDPSLPGQYVDLPAIYGGSYGNDEGPHTAPHMQQPVDYAGQGNSNPPAGGPHWSGPCPGDPTDPPSVCGPVPWGVQEQAWPAESLVHNMEHAGVVIWYNTADEDAIAELEAVVIAHLLRGQQIVMVPYPEMEQELIAITAWSRVDKFPVDALTVERVEDFIAAHDRRFNPEGF